MNQSGWVCIGFCALLVGCGPKKPQLDPDFARALAEKRALAQQFAVGETNPIPSDTWKFFELIERSDWKRANKVYEHLREQLPSLYPPKDRNGIGGTILNWYRDQVGWQPVHSGINGPLWGPVHDTMGIAQCFHEWDRDLLHQFGRDVIESIPTNSIYFGGTDAGRFIVTALSDSHREGRPFYTLTQNELADGNYLEYLRKMYGAKISVPTEQDSANAFQSYVTNFTQRVRSGKVAPGWGGGVSAVMEINGTLVNGIVQANPSHEIFVEESYPLEWMYPYMVPHGLIFKLHRDPMTKLDEAAVRKDHEYWKRYTGKLIGDWLTEETSMKEVCEFVHKVHGQKDLSAFTGNKAFARNEAAQKTFSKLRSSIAGLYAWRVLHANTEEEKAAMRKEAAYAYRQAVALCPSSDEVVTRAVNFLSAEQPQDARVLSATSQRLNPPRSQQSP